MTFRVDYEPAESRTGMFGGNSNWRGPVWFPINFLLIEALQRYNHYYGESLQVEFPTGSGDRVNLKEAADRISQRLSSLIPARLRRQAAGLQWQRTFQDDPQFRDNVLFYEFFNGDTGAGLGASHQTGWTGLVAKLLKQSGTAGK